MKQSANQKSIREAAQKALEGHAVLGATSQLILAAFVCLGFLNSFSQDFLNIEFLFVIMAASGARLVTVFFKVTSSVNSWLQIYRAQMFVTSISWSLFFINLAIHVETSDLRVFIFVGPVGLCAASFLNLFVSRSAAVAFQLPLQISLLVSSFIYFSDPKAILFAAIASLTFAVYTWFAQRKLNRDWITLQTNSRELQGIIDAIPGGLSVVQDGVYVKVNSYVTATLKSRENFINRSIGSVYPNSEFTKELLVFSTSTATRQQFEIVLPTVLGLRTHFIIFRKVHYEGQSEKIIISSFDIEEFKDVQQTLERQKAKLLHSAKMASLGEMSSGLAHEINNPLAVISARAQLMQVQLDANTYDKTQLMKSVETIMGMTGRISKIIKSLKLFAKDSSSEVYEIANLNEIIEQTLALCDVKSVSHSVAVTRKGLENNVAIECLPTQVSQVILNALNNSFDAIADLEKKWICLETFTDNPDVIRIEVTDSGKGIPDSLKEKVMRPFFTTKAAGAGTGLGLSLSKRIVENHGGQLFFDHTHANTKLVIVLPKSQSKADRQKVQQAG